MSVVVQCLSCAQQFDAPDELRGRRVQCPACGAAINVPAAMKAPQAVMPPSRGGMMDLLKEESRQRADGAENATGFDKGTIAALGISERKLFSGKAKAPPAEATARPIVYGGPLTHKLVIAVTAASLGFLALMGHLDKTSIGVIIWSLGILLAMATWRSQALAASNRKVADDWRTFERWTGFVVIALIFRRGYLAHWNAGLCAAQRGCSASGMEGGGRDVWMVGVGVVWSIGVLRVDAQSLEQDGVSSAARPGAMCFVS